MRQRRTMHVFRRPVARATFGKGMIRVNGDVLADEALNAAQIITFTAITERKREAFRPGTGRAANAVDIGFRFVGNVVIHHHRNAFDVNAAGGDVGRHQDAGAAGTECLQRVLALRLRFVAVNFSSWVPGGGKIAGEFLRAVLRAGKDEHEAFRVLVENVAQQRVFVPLRNLADALRDFLHRRLFGGHLDAHRLAQDAGGEFLDACRDRGREKERLALLGDFGQNAFDVGREAHVEHAVRFIEHKNFDLVEFHVALLGKVEQPARRGDGDVHALGERINLGALTDAAINDNVAQLKYLP